MSGTNITNLDTLRSKKAKESQTYEEFCKWSGISLKDKSINYSDKIVSEEQAFKRYLLHGWEIQHLKNLLGHIPNTYHLYEYIGEEPENMDKNVERSIDALYALVDFVDYIISKRKVEK